MIDLAQYYDGRHIVIHKPEDFEGMRRAGKLAAEGLDMLVEHIRPGVTTKELDDLAYTFIMDSGALPATIFYRGFSHSLCISLNHVICHGIPGERALEEGDILNIDITVILDGWHGDTSRMYIVGKAARKAERLVELTYEALQRGIAAAIPGNHIGDIGHAIQSFAEKNRLSVVRDFCGHGVGRVFHMMPNVVHAGEPGSGPLIRPGMFFTIEPMLNIGRPDAKILEDGWTAVTRDRSLSAQFEHSIGITETGHEIFTRSPVGRDCPPYTV